MSTVKTTAKLNFFQKVVAERKVPSNSMFSAIAYRLSGEEAKKAISDSLNSSHDQAHTEGCGCSKKGNPVKKESRDYYNGKQRLDWELTRLDDKVVYPDFSSQTPFVPFWNKTPLPVATAPSDHFIVIEEGEDYVATSQLSPSAQEAMEIMIEELKNPPTSGEVYEVPAKTTHIYVVIIDADNNAYAAVVPFMGTLIRAAVGAVVKALNLSSEEEEDNDNDTGSSARVASTLVGAMTEGETAIVVKQSIINQTPALVITEIEGEAN